MVERIGEEVILKMSLLELKKELEKLASPQRAKDSLWFFKTGKGEYGEGDKFLGVSGVVQRKLAKKYIGLSFKELQTLIDSPIHEHRQVSLLVLVHRVKSKKTSMKERQEAFEFYIKNARRINNWDLVDISAPYVVGGYLLDKPREILYQLAKSKNLWEKRISVISTFAFVREGQLEDTIKISEILLGDKHDLIHKAVGWALREVGSRDKILLGKFLDKHISQMPRTMLRYAIEKFPEKERKGYLRK